MGPSHHVNGRPPETFRHELMVLWKGAVDLDLAKPEG